MNLTAFDTKEQSYMEKLEAMPTLYYDKGLLVLARHFNNEQFSKEAYLLAIEMNLDDSRASMINSSFIAPLIKMIKLFPDFNYLDYKHLSDNSLPISEVLVLFKKVNRVVREDYKRMEELNQMVSTELVKNLKTYDATFIEEIGILPIGIAEFILAAHSAGIPMQKLVTKKDRLSARDFWSSEVGIDGASFDPVLGVNYDTNNVKTTVSDLMKFLSWSVGSDDTGLHCANFGLSTLLTEMAAMNPRYMRSLNCKSDHPTCFVRIIYGPSEQMIIPSDLICINLFTIIARIKSAVTSAIAITISDTDSVVTIKIFNRDVLIPDNVRSLEFASVVKNYHEALYDEMVSDILADKLSKFTTKLKKLLSLAEELGSYDYLALNCYSVLKDNGIMARDKVKELLAIDPTLVYGALTSVAYAIKNGDGSFKALFELLIKEHYLRFMIKEDIAKFGLVGTLAKIICSELKLSITEETFCDLSATAEIIYFNGAETKSISVLTRLINVEALKKFFWDLTPSTCAVYREGHEIHIAKEI